MSFAHHDVAAEDQERAQAQADDARDEGELALEDAALHGKVAHQLNGGAHQHHAAQGVADLLTGKTVSGEVTLGRYGVPNDGRRYIDEETDWNYDPFGGAEKNQKPCVTVEEFMNQYLNR